MTVRYEIAGGVATITLDRPSRRNAVTAEMQREFFDALLAAEADADVGAVVVTGAGSAFCGGVDFASLEGLSDGDEPGTSSHEHRDFPLAALAIPIVAAVNGPAIGLGFVYAAYADVRFAGAGATFAAPYARLGLIAEHGLSWLLPRQIGHGAAADLLLSGRTVDADEARTIGLVQRITPDDELLDAATAYARALATRCSPRSLSVIREQLRDDATSDFAASFDRSFVHARASFASADVAEAMAAVGERRAPRFPARRPPAA